jgi:hypothetical protein
MKFEIWESGNDRPQYLKFRNEGGEIQLYISDWRGYELSGGHLLNITSDGVVELMKNFNPELGFKVDAYGRVMVKGLNDKK